MNLRRLLSREGWRWAWMRGWMRRADLSPSGRFAARMAALAAPGYKGRCLLAELHPLGFVSPSAVVEHDGLERTGRVYLGDRVVLYRAPGGGRIVLREGVRIHRDTILETGAGGEIELGEGVHVQPRCQFSAYAAAIRVGARSQIAPGCSFYPYDHGMDPAFPIAEQPLVTRGPIVLEPEVWLGTGVIVLSGVRIGRGAVVGAGAVVTRDVPPGAVVAGVPARMMGVRSARRGEEVPA